MKRDFTLVDPSTPNGEIGSQALEQESSDAAQNENQKNVLRVHYKATTARMLRVAVNGFFESLNVIIQVMEELDVDVLHEKGIEGLEGVQGVEQGMTGTAMGVAG